MNIIELIKLKLDTLLENNYQGYENQIDNNIKHLITNSLLELNDDKILVSGKIGIRTFEDIEIKYENKLYKIDINTHNTDKVISLPSLLSIKRAKDFLSDYNNFIVYIFVDYKFINNEMYIVKISVQNIESLDWSYLSIQNLGKGQLQMKNITELIFNNNITRREWLSILKQKGSDYYNNLLLKITEYKTIWDDERLDN